MENSKAWFVVCCPNDRPDGPGKIFGPFHTKENAELDAAPDGCKQNHIVVYGAGSELVTSSYGSPWNESYFYYTNHPEEIPISCYHLYGWTLENAGIMKG